VVAVLVSVVTAVDVSVAVTVLVVVAPVGPRRGAEPSVQGHRRMKSGE
jgi:hypothetical protein